MPTATDTAERSLPAHASPHPLLTTADLHDPARFKTMAHIPLLDEHSDPDKGTITPKILETIARNSNALNDSGDHPALQIGHTSRKVTIVVVRPDGSKIVLPATPEHAQPDVVGYLSHFTVEPYNGKHCLYGDYHVHHEHADKVKQFPWRSVERVAPPEDGNDDGEDSDKHVVDRVALLKSPPERSLGIISYERDDCDCSDPIAALSARCLLRTAYSRDLPAITADDSPPTAGADCPCHDSATVTQYDEEPPMPEPPKAPPEAAAPPPVAPAAPAPPPDPAAADPAAAAATADTIGTMSRDELKSFIHDSVMNALMTLMPPEDGEGGDGGEPAGGEPAAPAPAEEPGAEQYESEDAILPGIQPDAASATPAQMGTGPDDNTDVRKSYAASEPGAANVFTPGAAGSACNGSARKPKDEDMERVQYERTVNDLKTALAAEKAARERYESDLTETQEVILALVEDRNEAKLYAKHSKVREELRDLVAQGWSVDIEKEVAKITLETPDEVFADRKEEIRTMHQRTPVNIRHTIPIGGVNPGGGKSNGIPTKEYAGQVADYAMAEGISIPEAKKALGFG